METAVNISFIIVATVFTCTIAAGLVERALTNPEERKTMQQAHRQHKAQADFWEKHGKDSLVTLSRKGRGS